MKTAEAQAEDQCKLLYTIQINLATEKAAVLDLKAELQKAQEALKVAKDLRDKKGTSVDSRDKAEVGWPQRTWAPRLEMEGAPIPYDASI